MKFSRRYILAAAVGMLVCVGSITAKSDVTPLLKCGLPQCPAIENVAAKDTTSLAQGLLTDTASAPAAAKDEWIQVKSKNFLLIGNASEKDIRKVATRLEQFRETFRLLFAGINLTSPIETNVVVFKSDGAYKNFKPKRADGKIDTGIAGYFQTGEDVNYITLAVGGDEKETYNTIFHEYVHFIVNTNFGKSEVPTWFNEGLAEYYSTFEIKNDQEVHLGLPQQNHLDLLSMSQLIPLDTLFKISNYELHNQGGHGRSIFYAESWALVHYLIQTGKSAGLSKFLSLVIKRTPPEKAFQDAFQISYADMQKELAKYVGKRSFQYNIFTFNNKLTFDADMQATPLDEAGSNAFLGDLLYHTNRADDAEPFLVNALALQPNSSMANTTLGMVRIKQRKYAEASVVLEKALAGDQKNPHVFYEYAFLLSRQGQDEFGFVRGFDAGSLAKMRDALNKAIAIAPAYTESYELFAYINLVANDQLDESAAMLKTALKYQPGNQRYALRLAEILSRQKKYGDAVAIAQKIASTADDPETKHRADEVVNDLNRIKQFNDQQVAERKRYEAQIAEANHQGETLVIDDPDMNLRAINRALRKTGDGETHVIGSIQRIDCHTRPLVFTVKTPTETFTVTTSDFDSLSLRAYTPDANKIQIGCDQGLAAFNAVITYKKNAVPKGNARGDLISIEFVDKNFHFVDTHEPPSLTKRTAANTGTESGTLNDPPPLKSADAEAQRRAMMLRALGEGLKKPGNGQKREMGYLEKIECSNKGYSFIFRTASKTFRLRTSGPNSLAIGVYVPDLNGMEFGCAIKPIEFPAVFIYTDKPDGKTKTDGEIVSLEFVPKSFVLDQ